MPTLSSLQLHGGEVSSLPCKAFACQCIDPTILGAKSEALPRVELGLLDSKSKVITTTPQRQSLRLVPGRHYRNANFLRLMIAQHVVLKCKPCESWFPRPCNLQRRGFLSNPARLVSAARQCRRRCWLGYLNKNFAFADSGRHPRTDASSRQHGKQPRPQGSDFQGQARADGPHRRPSIVPEPKDASARPDFADAPSSAKPVSERERQATPPSPPLDTAAKVIRACIALSCFEDEPLPRTLQSAGMHAGKMITDLGAERRRQGCTIIKGPQHPPLGQHLEQHRAASQVLSCRGMLPPQQARPLQIHQTGVIGQSKSPSNHLSRLRRCPLFPARPL